MNREEFDAFLKDKGVVYGERPINTSHHFAIGPGWYDLVSKLIDNLIAKGWDKQLHQCKQKFGGLRFYIGEGSSDVFELIDEAERKSLNVCESCGKPGSSVSTRGWLHTSCGEHVEK